VMDSVLHDITGNVELKGDIFSMDGKRRILGKLPKMGGISLSIKCFHLDHFHVPTKDISLVQHLDKAPSKIAGITIL